MCLISVIVPVFNAESVLGECVNSILNQSMSNFELILIDDGSSDNSSVICDYYSHLDQRVRVIHQRNRGAAAARNVGLTIAQGEYLAFCDSDDKVSSSWLSRMVALSGEDILVIGAYCSEQNALGKKKIIDLVPGKAYSIKDYYIFNRLGIAGYICNALYRKDVVDKQGICFRENKSMGDYNEDLLFAINYVQAVDMIVYTGFSDYYYRKHHGSLSQFDSRNYYYKYAEKYQIWDAFIHQYCVDHVALRKELATGMLYHFIGALRNTKTIDELKGIVYSPEMQKCLLEADTGNENDFEINMLRKKSIVALFGFYKALKVKEMMNAIMRKK